MHFEMPDISLYSLEPGGPYTSREDETPLQPLLEDEFPIVGNG